MSRQDKATTDRNARILRDLVKQPDNKTCADCRKNDARWASWNLGVFVCIRCSGMHRAMGTHISKVKSIDLDIWTPEQMANIQKWGNKRANAYWERHLKAGHVPPEHKIESFIRSKYESRRWAMEGPPPSDPSVLDGAGGSATHAAASPPPAQPAGRPQAQARPTPTVTAPTPRQGGAHPLLSRQARSPPTAAPAAAPAPLLNFFDDEPAAAKPTSPPAAAPAARPAQAQPSTTAAKAPSPTAAPAPQSNIFDLDFKAPTPPAQKQQTTKNDIMSLFSQPPPQQQQGSFFNQSSQFGSWNGGVTSTQPPVGQATAAPVPTWGGGFGDQAAWGGQQQQQPQPHQQQQAQPAAQQQGWGQPQQAQQQQWGQNASASANPWGSDPWAQPAQAAQPAPKKDDRDPFANIWS
ncbi:ArfGap-domain-containing protein [Cutaneotrichosporon oleaginosum]|uniref:ArfGap-domain-containing protein n=1 Tax=Cutaneotrichosporon oleaginosum TaxID=879819 RepID=A0A0J0XKA2_9TREE|nr:ArfGap-domain-containing protein [Cutaneotrichosporon oleaginosum]KLT41497.1 ArfGap-domain-containing protein [Cutaneotrichosporon oleaginosum]